MGSHDDGGGDDDEHECMLLWWKWMRNTGMEEGEFVTMLKKSTLEKSLTLAKREEYQARCEPEPRLRQ